VNIDFEQKETKGTKEIHRIMQGRIIDGGQKFVVWKVADDGGSWWVCGG
jgi:hypothetical protein